MRNILTVSTIHLLQELPVFLLLLQTSQPGESVLQPLLRVLQLLPQPVILVLDTVRRLSS